ncbi:hypothetical protein ACWC9T_07865 [Kitasatospora sp. NPDC001159]
MAGDLLHGRLRRWSSFPRPVGSPPTRIGIAANLRASIVDLTLTTINVTDGLLKVTAEYDGGWAGAEQSGRQAGPVVTTTAGPLR